ncbi:hypothetical protein V7138_11095 [Bacillus sp. JJ1533]|uniref:hypothetical protein n=1 Tax=Bacillus sp. JJ1533 TaxID=3122959 RepID=UPI002FFF4F65
MNKKELEVPLRIRKLAGLIGRLSDSHPKYQEISDEYGRRIAGYRGEQSLQYYLPYLKEKDYLIFHNLRLAISQLPAPKKQESPSNVLN